MDAKKSSDYSALQKPLEHFRAKTKRLMVHPAESLLVTIVCAHLVLVPWAMGGARIWVQVTSLCLAVIGFLVSLQPRNYTEEHTGGGEFRLHTWPKLVRFPIFWCGLALFAYILVQALNPAWQYTVTNGGWWMASHAHYTWLPQSAISPFGGWNLWRSVIVYLAAWLVVCSIWIGFTRRRSVQVLLIALAANGFLLAAFGIFQRMQSNGRMFWISEIDGGFFASFIYKNHAGAYLNLMIGVACGLAGWFYLRAQRRLDKSSPSGLFAFFAMTIAIAITVSYARGATIVMLAFVVLGMVGFIFHQVRRPAEERRPVVLLAMVLIFGGFLRLSLQAVNAGDAMDRMENLMKHEDASWRSREIVTKASLRMLGDNWLLGTGTGSYRYLFPKYQQQYPEILSAGGKRFVWEHAHNDLVEFPIELGLLGMLPIVVGLGWFCLSLLRTFFWENALSLALASSALLVLAASWADFPLHNHAVFLVWCALWPVALQWAQFEELNLKG